MPLNSIQQLISSTIRVSEKPYLMIVQHSMHQRHVMALTTSDAEVYRRARVRTPAQNAQRDYLGNVWIQYLANECVNTAKGLIWVETTGVIPVEASHHNVTILNAASNPFGWDDTENDGNETLMLENLQALAAVIQNRVEQHKRPVVIESLTPLLMRHCLSRTMAFLRKLMTCDTAIVVPVLIETLTPSQHRALEDMAQAVFYLQGGEMTLIRQGVRERGNTLREVIPFDVQTDEVDGSITIKVLKQEDNDKEEAPVSSPLDAGASDGKKREGPITQPTSRLGKIQLQLEEEETPAENEEVSHPHIYVQDNDPEFQDMDEEDPDDDLDI